MIPPLPAPQMVSRGAFSSAYFALGPEDGRPVMLVHGLCAHGLQFVEDARHFAGQGFRVIVPDLRGHGRSVAPPNAQFEDFGIGRLAGDLVAILDHAGVDTIDYVGNSLGGILALSLARSNPERLRSIATFGTAYALDLPKAVVPLGRWTERLAARPLLASVGALTTSTHAHARPVIRAMLASFDSHAMLSIGAHVRAYDLIGAARAFERPILMIRGDEDRLVNRALPRTIAAMAGAPHFSLADIRRAGHCANLDQPASVRSELIAFWSRRER